MNPGALKNSLVDVGAERADARLDETGAAWPRARVQQLAVTTGLTLACSAGIAWFGPLLGMTVPAKTLTILAFGAVAMELAPTRPLELATVIGLVALASTNRVYAAYHLALVAALYVARRNTIGMAVVLFSLAVALPKHLFQAHYHQPGFYNWINEPSLALTLFVTARWWRDRRDGRLPPAGRRDSLATFAALYFFPGHVANPIVYGASDLFRTRRTEARGVLIGLALVCSKALAHTAIARFLPAAGYHTLDATQAASLSWAALWGLVLINYVDLALTLSATADLAVMIARLYGWPMASPFRWALLAWNPVELWRRWGLYNRRLLLGLVYFPLGGGHRRRTLNVMLTFLASALIMHSGWFGSKYWEVGFGGWRDESVYFLLQGLVVCGCLLYGQWRGHTIKEGAGTPGLRWSWGRVICTMMTQACSALIHVVILAQAMPLTARFGVMARCLGLR